MAAFITLKSKIDDFAFQAWHEPAQGHRRGGVIVLQEIFGIDAYVKADCARWARAGFEALAPSLFDRQEPGFCAAHTPEGIQEGFRYAQANGLDNPIHDIETCADRLKAQGPVFVVGYCYGGSLAYLAACKIGALSAASSYYGSLVPQHGGSQPLVPVICHFGRQDGFIPLEAVEAFERARPDVPVYVYEAGHGFNNEGGPAYDAAAAHLARERTLELFRANGAL